MLQASDEVVVYMTYVNSPAYFCIQLEDSVIGELSEVLQTHCKVSCYVTES